MKFLIAATLVGASLISGCANFATPSKKAAETTTTHSDTQVAIHAKGPLQAITAVEITGFDVTRLTPPTEIWDRIRRGFAMPNLHNELVTEKEQWYAARPDYMQRMAARSDKYLFHIVEELERRNMPTELALLPFVESAFNPQAVSSAKAAGMWQFMPATGSYFQLKQNAFRDDRRDVLASTRAALDYLEKLYGMFNDWQLALAAYNWGEGSVGRAIAKNEKQKLPITYEDLTMPEETRHYVPKLQAIKNIVANPEAFQLELPLIPNHPYFQSVDLFRDIDVALAAKLADVVIEDFKALNPSIHRPVILAAGTPEILLPWDNAEVFRRNLAAYDEAQYASWTVWTVPSTMGISAAAQHAKMSEKDLRSINNIPPRMLIKAGSALIVPRAANVQKDVGSHIAENGQVHLTPEVVTRRTVVKAQAKGDSVSKIAARYKVTAAQVAQWNKVSDNAAFKSGQAVVLYLPVKASSPPKKKSQGQTTQNSRPKVAPKNKASAPKRSSK